MKYDIKSLAFVVFLSYAVATILNILIHYIFPSFPIVKSGFALILILVSIVLVMLFTVASDGKFETSEIVGMLVILGIMAGVYFVVEHFVPELFAVVPEGIKEAFSILP